MYVQYPDSEEKPKKERSGLFYFGIAAVVIFGFLVVIAIFSGNSNQSQQSAANQVVTQNSPMTNNEAKKFFRATEITSNQLPTSVSFWTAADCPDANQWSYTVPAGYSLASCQNGDKGSHGGCPACIMSQISLKSESGQSKTQTQKGQGAQSDSQSQQAEIDALKSQLNALQNAPPKPASASGDLSVIIAEWKNRVAQVKCTWNYTNGTSIELDGSATLVSFSGQGTTAITNKHVLLDINGYTPNYCVVGIYGGGGRIVTMDAPTTPFGLGSSEDYGYIYLDNQYQLNNGSYATDGGTFDTIVANRLNVCTSEPNIGDNIVVLGYPAIGTSGGITATEGIISGIESDYYVTSAKIDHGNSGGAAISVKNDCYLGIPTWAQSGSIESLGRILKASFAVGQ